MREKAPFHLPHHQLATEINIKSVFLPPGERRFPDPPSIAAVSSVMRMAAITQFVVCNVETPPAAALVFGTI